MRFNGSVSGGVSGMMEILGEGDTVSITPALTSGVEVATFKINEGTAEEETIKLYAPEGFSGSWNDLTDKPTLFSGSYPDLSNKPTLNGNVINGNIYTHNYSYQEHVVGTWVDGKPLYEKTIPFGVISGDNYSLSLGVANIDKAFFIGDGSYVNDGVCPLPYVIGRDNSNNIGGFFTYGTSDSTFDFRIGSGMAGYIENGCITVRYTKTTD